MITGRKDEELLRDKTVKIHVTKSEKELLKQIASTNGMNVSEFIRLICLYRYNDIVKEIIHE